MGGQNHQPTKPNAAAVSALVSQRVGRAFENILKANSSLENTIIIGMNAIYIEDIASGLTDDGAIHLETAVECLDEALREIQLIDQGFDRMFKALEIEKYTGNPLVSKLRDMGLREKFSGLLVQPSPNSVIWEELENRIAQSNIIETLRWERGQFQLSVALIEDLKKVLLEGISILQSKGARAFVDSVEENKLPLRQYYARVFSFWNYLHNMFLYSALIMTELFYRSSEYPSLLEFNPPVQPLKRLSRNALNLLSDALSRNGTSF